MKTPSEISLRARGSRRHVSAFLVGACLIFFGSGCTNVGVMHQRLVSKPNMTFSDSAVFDYAVAFHDSIEPGTSTSGGAQASGCTACK